MMSKGSTHVHCNISVHCNIIISQCHTVIPPQKSPYSKDYNRVRQNIDKWVLKA